MFIDNKYIKAIFATLSALAISSCVNLDEGKDDGVGYLSVEGLAVDVSVLELVPTKSGTTFLSALGVTIAEGDKPTLENTTFTLKRDEDVIETWTGTHDVFTLKAGTYSLTASYNGENDGFGKPHYGDTTVNVTVESLKETSASVSLPLANALVKVTVADDLTKEGHFVPGEGKPVSFSISESFEAALDQYVFVPAATAMDIKVSGTNSAGVKADMSMTLAADALKAKDARSVIFGKKLTEWPSIAWAEGQDLNDGAFEGGLYFAPVKVSNMSAENVAKLVYEIKTGDSDWSPVAVSDVSGYKYISSLTDGTTYSIRARVGNIISEEKTFTPVTLESCIENVEVSAEHTKNTSGELNGTAVTTSVTANLPTIISEIGTLTLSGSFNNAKGKERATLNGASVGENGASEIKMNEVSGWPYIPKGTHSFAGTFTLTLPNRASPLTLDSSVSDIAVPAPEFTVTVSAETSYSRYVNYTKSVSGYTLALANTTGTGDRVMDISATIGISSDILGNDNYKSLLGDATLTYDGLSMLTSPAVTTNKISPNTLASQTTIDGNKGLLDGDDVVSQAYGAHNVAASFTFDQTKKEHSLPCHVTGLPYTYDLYDKSVSTLESAGWTCHDVSYTLSKCTIQYDGSNGYLISPKYHIPDPINMGYEVQAQYYRAWTIDVSSKKIDLRVGLTSSTSSVASSYNTYQCSGNNDTGKSFSTTTGTLTMTSSLPYVSFHHNNANVSAQVDYLCLYQITFKYQ